MDVAWNLEAGVTDGDGKGCDQFQNNDSAASFFFFPASSSQMCRNDCGKTHDYRPEAGPASSLLEIAEVVAQQRGQGSAGCQIFCRC